MLDSPRFATMGRWRRTEVVKVNLAIDAGSLCYTSCCLTCAGGTVLSLLLLLLLLLLSLLLLLLLVKFVLSSFVAAMLTTTAHLLIFQSPCTLPPPRASLCHDQLRCLAYTMQLNHPLRQLQQASNVPTTVAVTIQARLRVEAG